VARNLQAQKYSSEGAESPQPRGIAGGSARLTDGTGRRARSSGRRGRRFKSCHPDSWLKGPDLREHVQGPSAIPASGMPGAQRENVAASRWGRRFHVDTGLHFADRLEDHPRSSQSFASGRSTMTNEVLSKYSWRAAAGLQQQAHPAAPSPHHLGTHPLPGMATSVPHQPQATDCPGARGRRLPASSEPSFRSACGRSSLACAAVIHHTSDRIHVVTAT